MDRTADQKPDTTASADVQAIMPKPRTDRHIWGIYIFLCIISIVELYSASSHEVTSSNIFRPVIRHVTFLVIGLVIMLALQRTHYRRFYNMIYVFAAISVIAMIYTMFFGEIINGARRGFSIGFATILPAEMIKLSAALIIARLLCTCQIKGKTDVTTAGVVKVGIVVICFGGLLFSQGLTNTILLMAISLSMMLVGGVGARKFMAVVGIYALLGGVGVGYKLLSDKGSPNKDNTEIGAVKIAGTDVTVAQDLENTKQHENRSATWMARIERHFSGKKYDEPINDKNRQEQYSYIAQANGGIFGVFPGNSRETSRLPLAFSDYIYAIVIEDCGLIGGLIVMLLYLWLLGRAGRVATRCQTAFPALLVTGMAVFISYQAMFHMAIVTGVFPVSGQPLPLISKGGTSIIITSMALGIMLSVSRFAARKGIKAEIKEELSALPEDVRAENPT